MKITIFSGFEKHLRASENFTFAPLHTSEWTLSTRSQESLRRVTVEKGPKAVINQNLAFLLVKSFKLVSRHLDEGPRPRQIKL